MNTNFLTGAEASSTEREQSVHSVVSPATTPTVKMGHKHELIDWVKATPIAQRWYDKLARRSKTTAKTYVDDLYKYWRDHLSKRLPSIEAWVAEVKEQSFSRDLEEKRAWAAELESYYLERPLKRKSRRLMIASIRNFFKDKVELSQGYDFTLGSGEEAVKEADQRRELTPLSKDEVKTVIEHRPSPLYKLSF